MPDPRQDPAEPANLLMRLTCNSELSWRARLLCAGALMIEILPDDLWRGIKLDDGEGWIVPIDPEMMTAALEHSDDVEAGWFQRGDEATKKCEHLNARTVKDMAAQAWISECPDCGERRSVDLQKVKADRNPGELP